MFKKSFQTMNRHEGDFDESTQMVIEEGKNAFSNDIACSDNPYKVINNDLANLWELGWIKAEKNRAYYLPKMLKAQLKAQNRDQAITDVIEVSKKIIESIFIFLVKAVLVVAGICLVIFLIYKVAEVVGSWPSWAIVIMVLLLMILDKR